VVDPVTRRPTASPDDPLSSAPEYAEWIRAGDALAARRASLDQQIRQAQQSQQKADAAHSEAVTAAVRSGAAIPETPAGVDFSPLNRASDVQRADEQSHRDRRAAVVASVAGEVLAKLRERERARQELLVALGAKLDALVDEARRDVAVARDVLDSEDDGLRTYPSRAARLPTPSGAGLLDAAKAGRSLLDPTPLPPRNVDTDGMARVDRSHEWQQHAREPMER
jgi:hypothetical protein